MALGEYVSVSSQRDSERALIAKEEAELATMPYEELAELTKLYQDKGLSPQTARQVAEADRDRRPGGASGCRTQHRSGRHRQPLASRVRLGHRLSDRRAAANSGDHPVSRHDSHSGNVCRRAGCLGDHRRSRRLPRRQSDPAADHSGRHRRGDRASGNVPHRSSAGHHSPGLGQP